MRASAGPGISAANYLRIRHEGRLAATSALSNKSALGIRHTDFACSRDSTSATCSRQLGGRVPVCPDDDEATSPLLGRPGVTGRPEWRPRLDVEGGNHVVECAHVQKIRRRLRCDTGGVLNRAPSPVQRALTRSNEWRDGAAPETRSSGDKAR